MSLRRWRARLGIVATLLAGAGCSLAYVDNLDALTKGVDDATPGETDGASGDGGPATGDGSSPTDGGVKDAGPRAKDGGGPWRIMPLGDSITLGFGSSSCLDGGCSGYRFQLYEKLKGRALSFEFVGSQVTGPPEFPSPQHEGYANKRIDGIQDKVIEGIITLAKPDIVLLHIGMEDIVQGYAITQAPDRVGTLIEQLAGAAPDALILVAAIVPIKGSPDGWDVKITNYNDAVAGVVAEKARRGKHVVSVDLHSLFNQAENSPDYSADLTDHVHPGDVGYEKMASRWVEALSTLVK